MFLRRPRQVRMGRSVGRRARAAGALIIASAVMSLTGCTVTAGSALQIDGHGVSEQSVQRDTAAFIAESGTTTPTDAQRAAVNRAQLTYLIRHALIARAIAAQGITVPDQEVNAATAQLKARQGQDSGLAVRLQLPNSDEDGVIHDLVALEALVKTIPAAGTQVTNVSVTAEGVPAASRDEAVALRSKYLADPASMDAAVQAAQNGVPKNPYQLISAPTVARADGLFQPHAGQIVILPNSATYLVLRTTGRTVGTAALTQAQFTSAGSTGLADVFDLGALLVSKYQDSAGISVNPRYGVWDPASVQVVPGNDGL